MSSNTATMHQPQPASRHDGAVAESSYRAPARHSYIPPGAFPKPTITTTTTTTTTEPSNEKFDDVPIDELPLPVTQPRANWSKQLTKRGLRNVKRNREDWIVYGGMLGFVGLLIAGVLVLVRFVG